MLKSGVKSSTANGPTNYRPKISCVVTRYRDKIATLASTLKRAPWVTALKPLGDKGRKGFPPSSVQDLMHVGYQSNHGTHPTSSLPPTTATPPISPTLRSRSDRWLKRSDCVPQGAACGCHMGVITLLDPPLAERTHLFGSLMSNTDVTVTRTLMMSTAAGSRTMRPPKSPDLRPRRRVLFAATPNIIFTR